MNIDIQFRNKLKEISEILDRKTKESNDIGVLAGISGAALFQFYYSEFLNDDIHADKGVEVITEIVKRINDGFNYPTFCSGIAGACWMLEILKEEEFIELEDDFLSSDIDLYLLEAMRVDIIQENFDFLHGAMGYGYYFFKRYQNVVSETSKKSYKAYVNELIEALKKNSKRSDKGIWWESVLEKEEGIKGCNLSLSHGISSTVNFLSRLARYEDFHDNVKELIKQTTNYILGSKNKEKSTATFPNWIVEGNVKEDTSRLAWCYGDLGIGVSLLQAGEVLQDTHLYEEAISVLTHTTSRRDIKEAMIMDAGICHGAYGVLHIYSYLYKKTKNIAFKDACDFWAEQALLFGKHENGYAGYMVWRGAKEKEWENEVSLLEGVAGIGLVMLSYLSPFKTTWDECLLIG